MLHRLRGTALLKEMDLWTAMHMLGLSKRLQHSMTALSTPLCMLSSFTRPIMMKSTMIHLRMTTISVHAAARRVYKDRRPALPKAIWQSLAREDQIARDQVSDEAKKAIMFAYKHEDSPAIQPPAPKFAPAPKRHINASEMALPILDNDPEPDDHQNDDEGAEDEEYDLIRLINQATHHVDPGDIHHVLSPPPTTKKDKRRTKPNDMQVVTLHETVYNVSASHRFIQQSSQWRDCWRQCSHHCYH